MHPHVIPHTHIEDTRHSPEIKTKSHFTAVRGVPCHCQMTDVFQYWTGYAVACHLMMGADLAQ